MYNILDEKWIPVVDDENGFYKVSLKELILEAHMYRELSDADSILECALYRFLFTFASDMVFSKYGEDEELEDIIEALIEEGCFTKEILDNYLQICEADETSFDIFDKTRPFMQNGAYDYKEEDINSIAKINPRAASGTNKLFQNHISESDYSITNEEAVKYLLAYSPFNTPGGSGWGAGHFGAYPPLFTYIIGKNLFDTIIFNLIRNEGIEREDNKPYWRISMDGVRKNTEAPVFSIYASMHYPWRFLKLIPDEDKVRKMYYVPGYKIDKTRPDILPDPYVTYLFGKNSEDRFPFCPKDSDTAWKNITGLFDLRSAPAVVRNYALIRGMLGLDRLNVFAYVTIVKDVHGTFTGAWKNKVNLPSEVLNPSNPTLDNMKWAIEYANKKLWTICKASENVIGKDLFKGKKHIVENEFNSICRDAFFNRFIPNISRDGSSAIEEWKNDVTNAALDIYEEQVIEPLSDLNRIKTAYEARKSLFDKREEKQE